MLWTLYISGRSKANLSSHRKTHQRVKKHVCNICGRGFLFSQKVYIEICFVKVIISRWALAREGDYEMMSVCVCVCVRACVRALVSHADFSKTTTATDFL